MMAFGFLELLVILLATSAPGSHFSPDLVSLLDPVDYFKSRRLPRDARSLVEMAGRDAATTQDEVAQLFALHLLAAECREGGEAKDTARKALETAARRDAGFVPETAKRLLGRLDGKSPAGTLTLPEGSLRKDALGWFPQETGFAMGLDLRGTGKAGVPGPDSKKLDEEQMALIAQGRALLPNEAREAVYSFLDSVGNVRLDRVTMGYAPAADNQARIMIRFTGRANHQNLARFLSRTVADGEVVEEKAKDGTPISAIPTKSPPALAVVGDTDLVMAGYENNQGDHLAVVRHILGVRAGAANATSGPLTKSLAMLPADARAVLVGQIPPKLGPGLPPVLGALSQVRASVVLVDKPTPGALLQIEADAGSEAAAREAVAWAQDNLKQHAIPAVTGLAKQLPGDAARVLEETLQGIKFEATGGKVLIRGHLSVPAQRVVSQLVAAQLKAAAQR